MEPVSASEAVDILKKKLDPENLEKLLRINNSFLHRFIATYVGLCEPDEVFVCNDSPEDLNYIRRQAIELGEEKQLAMEGHTVHFDGYFDQARDKAKTKFLLPQGEELGEFFNCMNREEGLAEIFSLLRGIMRGKKLFICFFTLGPVNSPFAIPVLQLTDSAYVAHSEIILYRPGYEEFLRRGETGDFFKFVHSAGELDERNNSKNIDKRRVYIDLVTETVYSVNTQYGGNTIGAKKLALRLAIRRASKEGWLAEHMFLMGVKGPGGRKTYFTGAYPSMCGKTSTAMLEGETIVGDDIAYLKVIDGEVRAANVEKGIFGIIHGVNPEDDPIIWKALHSPGEIIFSNVLITPDGDVYWTGSGKELPEKGENYSGEWYPGKKGPDGKEVPPSHKNARFTIELSRLENLDENLDNPKGVAVGGIIYGGRDSDTWVPVEEAFDWVHGVVTKGASLESETTAATLEGEGVRKFNPFSNLDFLSIPIGRYIQNHIEFGKKVANPPKIFSVNYFLKDEQGNFLNDKLDKKVWLKWMELRVRGEVEAVETPTGLIPKYEDLVRLFKEVLGKDYSKEDYEKQFMLRVNENLAKIERITQIYKTKVKDTPKIVFEILEAQRRRLLEVKEKYGEYVSPFIFSS